MYRKVMALFKEVIFYSLIRIILRQKYRNQFYYWYWNLSTTALVGKKLALTFWWPSTNKITITQNHYKLILYSSWHVQRVLVVATKVEQRKIRVGNERLLVKTVALIARTFTQRETSCHHWWYLCLLHWIIQSSIHLSCPRFVNSNTDLHRTLLVITVSLIERTVNQRAMGCHHCWYLCLLHWTIQSLIHCL